MLVIYIYSKHIQDVIQDIFCFSKSAAKSKYKRNCDFSLHERSEVVPFGTREAKRSLYCVPA